MKLFHLNPSVYSMFRQKNEDSLSNSRFVLHSQELEEYEKKKSDRFEICPELKYSIIADLIEKHLGTNIVVMDPAVYINKVRVRDFYKYILNFKDQDLCLARNNKRNSLCASFMKIKCTKKTLALFRHVLERIKKNQANSPEEPVINNVIEEWKERITFSELNNKIVCTPFIVSDAIRKNYYAWAISTRSEGMSQTKLYNHKVKIVYDHRFINREDFAYYKV